MQLHGLMEVRDAAHDFYAKIRGILPESAVDTVIDRLTCNTTLDLGITKSEWTHCLENPQVKKLLDELCVDEELRLDIIDCIDADGSGVVTTAELHEGLMMCRDPPRAHELLEVRLKIREMQQWLRNRLKPEVQSIRRTIMAIDDNGVRLMTKDQRQEERTGSNGEGSSRISIGASGMSHRSSFPDEKEITWPSSKALVPRLDLDSIQEVGTCVEVDSSRPKGGNRGSQTERPGSASRNSKASGLTVADTADNDKVFAM